MRVHASLCVWSIQTVEISEHGLTVTLSLLRGRERKTYKTT